ncbi:MAG: LysM peptidoglycan-binding domain-containing protein [Chloroflexi bacterium]|nr:LysM peptidoglycan-binding domain-containing protein [Chloroflexota bacterium]
MKKGILIPFRKMIFFLLLLVLLLGITASTSYAAPTEDYGTYHTVSYGETLSLIALNYGVTVHDLLVANPQIINPNLIYYGTVIYIPYQYTPPVQNYCRYYHTVSYGENLINIGLWYGLSPYVIAEVNHIYNLNTIYAGQSLCIP